MSQKDKKVKIKADSDTVEYALRKTVVFIEDEGLVIAKGHPTADDYKLFVREVERAVIYMKALIPKFEKLSSQDNQEETK